MKWYTFLFAGVLSVIALAAGAFGGICVMAKSPTQGLILIALAFLLVIVIVAIVSSERRFAKETSVRGFGRTLAETQCDCWFDGVNYENVSLRVKSKAISLQKGHELNRDIFYDDLIVHNAIRGSDECGSNLIIGQGETSFDCVISDPGLFDYVVDALKEVSGEDVAVKDWTEE